MLNYYTKKIHYEFLNLNLSRQYNESARSSDSINYISVIFITKRIFVENFRKKAFYVMEMCIIDFFAYEIQQLDTRNRL